MTGQFLDWVTEHVRGTWTQTFCVYDSYCPPIQASRDHRSRDYIEESTEIPEQPLLDPDLIYPAPPPTNRDVITD